MGQFTEQARSHQEALLALRSRLALLKSTLADTQRTSLSLGRASQALGGAQCALDALSADASNNNNHSNNSNSSNNNNCNSNDNNNNNDNDEKKKKKNNHDNSSNDNNDHNISDNNNNSNNNNNNNNINNNTNNNNYNSNNSNSNNDAAELVYEAALSLASLREEQEESCRLLVAAAALRGASRAKSREPRRKSPAETGGRAPVDFSAFTRARWEAERRKVGDSADGSAVKIWMQELPKPFPEEKACSQVRGRHILVGNVEKVRRIYAELAVTGTPDRNGFLRNASVAKFNTLAIERSDCPSGKKGGDLGWISKGSSDSKLQDVALVTPRGACSPPFRSHGGFHLFLCEERK